eukprot:145931-Amorphochlora_amoeboformis.AAC.2
MGTSDQPSNAFWNSESSWDMVLVRCAATARGFDSLEAATRNLKDNSSSRSPTHLGSDRAMGPPRLALGVALCVGAALVFRLNFDGQNLTSNVRSGATPRFSQGGSTAIVMVKTKS